MFFLGSSLIQPKNHKMVQKKQWSMIHTAIFLKVGVLRHLFTCQLWLGPWWATACMQYAMQIWMEKAWSFQILTTIWLPNANHIYRMHLDVCIELKCTNCRYHELSWHLSLQPFGGHLYWDQRFANMPGTSDSMVSSLPSQGWSCQTLEDGVKAAAMAAGLTLKTQDYLQAGALFGFIRVHSCKIYKLHLSLGLMYMKTASQQQYQSATSPM